MEEIISPWLLWLIAAALLTIIELITNTFAAFCLVGGCLTAMVAALLGFGIETQLACAAIGTVLAFIAFTPLIKRRKAARRDTPPSNMDALVGRVASVTEPTGANGIGRIRIDGDNWQFRTPDFSAVEAGRTVRIAGYDSIVLIVEMTD